jgi:protein TonB
MSVSLIGHGLLVVALAAVITVAPEIRSETTPADPVRFVFAAAAPASSGGGGSATPTPVASSTPPASPAVVPPAPTTAPPIPTQMPTTELVTPIAGVVGGIGLAPSPLVGVGGGGGGGTGSGTGDGHGDGVGTGVGGGVGGGVMGAGSGAVPPTLLRSAEPRYTAAAMQARVQGVVQLEVVISPAGVVTDVRILRSIDHQFGLDEEAVKTARLWRFRPATFQGQAVAYRVVIELEFRLR